jgi:Fic family protein
MHFWKSSYKNCLTSTIYYYIIKIKIDDQGTPLTLTTQAIHPQNIMQTPPKEYMTKLMTIVDDVKDSIPEGKYLELCNTMKDLFENKKVIGPKKDVLEVLNAISVYDEITHYKLNSEKDFLKAHAKLMKGLIKNEGKYRNQSVGIAKGNKIQHIAPPFKNVPHLMKDLFDYLKNDEELTLIKSCVFHYEMEFIHPFIDGNGRMGRLWQTVILLNEYPVFEFLPFETLISETQKEYYKALSLSDKSGKSTPLIEYMLGVIETSLAQLLSYNNRTFKDVDRLEYFLNLGLKEFSRKDYMNIFKDISSATSSRDLKKGIAMKLFKSYGELNKTIYRVR